MSPSKAFCVFWEKAVNSNYRLLKAIILPMCGITGFINLSHKKVSLKVLKRMNQTITHRGPDDDGEEILGNLALANSRLAIIDLSPAAHMPMANKNKSLWITYNGEVYNFKQLREELIKKGYRFKSDSDTEVILNLYHTYGPDCVKKLNGIFALAIWDVKKKQLFLTRDHFGTKPLHYYLKDDLFIFGSEIKAILAHPQVKKSLNLESLSQYFSIGFGAVPSPNTIFEHIYKLPPASYAIFKNGRLAIKRYWSLEMVKPSSLSFPEAKEQLLDLFSESVEEQLISDVPLGGFLSGGIDSSTVVALMKKHHQKEVKTFSIGFDDPDFDESEYAFKIAKKFKTRHFNKKFKISELINLLPEVINKMDEPLADGSILPTYLLSRFTRRQVTVALSGDGGDELFAGYPTYLAHKATRLANFIPKPIYKTLLPLIIKAGGIVPLMKHAPNISSQLKLKRFILGMNRDLGKQYLNFMGPINIDEKNQLFNHSLKEKVEADPALGFVNKLIKRTGHFDQQQKLQFIDLYIYLAEDCLVKTDRASSFNSLEVRVPLLTPKIAEFAFSLPSHFHLKGFTLKHLFKEAVKDLLPEEIVNQPKKGFGIPIHTWLKKDLKSLSEKMLDKKRLKRQGLFNLNYLNQLISEHQSGQEDHRQILWSLLIFQMWHDQWLK